MKIGKLFAKYNVELGYALVAGLNVEKIRTKFWNVNKVLNATSYEVKINRFTNLPVPNSNIANELINLKKVQALKEYFQNV